VKIATDYRAMENEVTPDRLGGKAQAARITDRGHATSAARRVEPIHKWKKKFAGGASEEEH